MTEDRDPILGEKTHEHAVTPADLPNGENDKKMFEEEEIRKKKTVEQEFVLVKLTLF